MDSMNIIFTIIMLAICLPIALSILYSYTDTGYIPPDTTGCGIIINENVSESYEYTYPQLIGKLIITKTETRYYHDLVCTNGTVILRWSK